MAIKKILIIAEAGVNHNGDLKIAKKLVKEAKKSGADIIKFQTFSADSLSTEKAKLANYQRQCSRDNNSQHKLLQNLSLTKDMHYKLKHYCDKLKIEFCSTAFDIDSLKFLISLGVKRIKIASGEITNYSLLKYISKLNYPIILSTGMSKMKEINQALNILTDGSKKRKNITILHCNSAYPTPMKDVNLKSMSYIKKNTKYNVGFSDHTLGIEVPIAASALGATIIEKHFTLDRKLKGPDQKTSLEPNELMLMVNSIRNIELALGNFEKNPTKSELKNKKIVRKSLVASKKIVKGELFTIENITAKRPGNGISPMKLKNILGKKSKKNYKIDDLISA